MIKFGSIISVLTLLLLRSIGMLMLFDGLINEDLLLVSKTNSREYPSHVRWPIIAEKSTGSITDTGDEKKKKRGMLTEVQVILVEIKTLTRTRKALTTLRSILRPSLRPFRRHLPLNPTRISLLINERRIMGSTCHRESARPARYPEHPGLTTNISARTVS